jgi:hypothetical protein
MSRGYRCLNVEKSLLFRPIYVRRIAPLEQYRNSKNFILSVLIFITVKTQLLNHLMTIIRQHVSTLWASSSGLYKELKTI